MAARMQPCRGFTLIEVLVALAIMAVMAVMSWQAIDGMTRAQERARAHADGTLALQAAFAQWHADLDAMMVWPQQLAAAAAPPDNPSGSPSGGSPWPTQWLDAATAAQGNAALLLGPDPIIGPQAVALHRAGSPATLQVATDGLRPFAVSAPGGPADARQP